MCPEGLRHVVVAAEQPRVELGRVVDRVVLPQCGVVRVGVLDDGWMEQADTLHDVTVTGSLPQGERAYAFGVPRLDGSTRVSLTVTDIDRSTQWYGRVFGFVVLGEVTSPEFRFRTLLHERSFASLALAQPLDVRDRAFDEGRVGLHHLAYHVPERADLVDWSRHLDSLEVAHSGVLK